MTSHGVVEERQWSGEHASPWNWGPPSTSTVAARREGRFFGGIVLAAFLLYGIGSGAADQPLGLALVAVNSVAVAVAGVIGFRLLRSSEPGVGVCYLAARVAEAVLLFGGIVLADSADVGDAGSTGYLLGMVALGVGSIPFSRALGRGRWIPHWLATWGVYGYAALLVGALLELATGRSLAVVFAAPGGLFEVVLGLFLVRHGFGGRRSQSSSAQHRDRHGHVIQADGLGAGVEGSS